MHHEAALAIVGLLGNESLTQWGAGSIAPPMMDNERREPSFRPSVSDVFPSDVHPLDDHSSVGIGPLQSETPKRRYRGLWFILAVAGVLWFVSYSNDQAKKEDAARDEYLAAHPLTPKQVAANKHFSDCWVLRHASSYEMSENQRKMMLGLEGCYDDSRDDPRYDDASYPTNWYAPHPWKAE
jgi:hypothetical protein